MYYAKYKKYKNKYCSLKGKINNFNIDNYKRLANDVKKEILPVFEYVKDIKYELTYMPNFKEFVTNLHLGQRKLFLNELQFLTKYSNLFNEKSDESKSEYVIYAGAAPNNHIYFLYELFPNIKFIIVDPSPFNIFLKNPNINHLNTKNSDVVYIRYGDKIQSELLSNDSDFSKLNFYDPIKNEVVNYKENIPTNSNLGSFSYYDENSENIINFIKTSSYKIFIFQDIYTNELSNLYRKIDNSRIYFFSDIRTKLDIYPTDLDILWNLSQQFNWTKILQPSAFMLKFRCPYFTDFKNKTEGDINDYINDHYDNSFNISKKFGIDFIKNYVNHKLLYFDGEYILQPWAPVASTEIRLVNDNLDDYTYYDCFDAEKKFAYFNNIDRTFVRHFNNYVDKSIGFDYCNDCSLEALIWEDFLKKHPHPNDLFSEEDQYDKSSLPVLAMVNKLSHVLGKGLKKKGHGYLFKEPTNEWYLDLKNKFCNDVKGYSL